MPSALLSRTEGKNLFERRGHAWGDNIEMNLNQMRYEAWTGLIELRMRKNGGLL